MILTNNLEKDRSIKKHTIGPPLLNLRRIDGDHYGPSGSWFLDIPPQFSDLLPQRI